MSHIQNKMEKLNISCMNTLVELLTIDDKNRFIKSIINDIYEVTVYGEHKILIYGKSKEDILWKVSGDHRMRRFCMDPSGNIEIPVYFGICVLHTNLEKKCEHSFDVKELTDEEWYTITKYYFENDPDFPEDWKIKKIDVIF